VAKNAAPKHKDTRKEKLEKLGCALRAEFERIKRERLPLEERWMRSYRQWKGIYDPEVDSAIPADRSHAYPRVTRVKGSHLISRLIDLTSERNFDIEPSPIPSIQNDDLMQIIQQVQGDPDQIEKAIHALAKERADNLKNRVTDQLKEMDYEAVLNRVIKSGVMYGIGVACGPTTAEVTRRKWVVDPITGQYTPMYEEESVPQFEYVSIWDFYPDMSALSLKSMDRMFRTIRLGEHDMYALLEGEDKGENEVEGEAEQDTYADVYEYDTIRKWLDENPKGNYRRPNYQKEVDMDNEVHTTDGDYYELVSFYGFVSGTKLDEYGIDVPEDSMTTSVAIEVVLLEDKVIKIRTSPYPVDVPYYHIFVLDPDDDNQIIGESFPESVRDSQMGICAAARQISDNSAVVCGPMVEIDTQKLRAGSDKTLRSFQVFERENNSLSADDSPAIRNVSIDSRITELLAVYNMWKELMDDESMIPPVAMGNVQGEAMRTVGGVSQIAGAATMTLRNMLRSIDSYTQSVISALVEWNYEFKPSKDILGDSTVAIDKSMSLVAKEIRALRLIDTLQYLPQDIRMTHVEGAELARLVFETQDISTKGLLKTAEQVAESQKIQAEAAQAAIELEKARANKLNASAEAQRASIVQRSTKQQTDTMLAANKQQTDAALAAREQEMSAMSAQNDRAIEASRLMGDLAKTRMEADAQQVDNQAG